MTVTSNPVLSFHRLLTGVTGQSYNAQARAHKLFLYARLAGWVSPPSTCEYCGKVIKLYPHHHNGYDDAHALDVQWICQPCHSRVHNGPHSQTAEARSLRVMKAHETRRERAARGVVYKLGGWETRRRNAQVDLSAS